MGDFWKNLEVWKSESENHEYGIRMLITPFYREIQKIEPYLNNFLTNPMHILAYSGDSDPKSPEYAKKV